MKRKFFDAPILIALALLLLLLLFGCTGMPDVKVDGLPPLKVSTYIVPDGEVFTHCAPALGGYMKAVMMLPLACAIINLQKGVCVIILGENSPQATREHEALHCQGYWHDDGLREYRDAWRSNLERDI